MFQRATQRNTPRAVPQSGSITPLAIPFKGLNAQSPFAVMSREYAITLVNLLSESYGLRVRKGYTEWATGIPGNSPTATVMSYYPASTVEIPELARIPYVGMEQRVFSTRRAKAIPPVGKLFAARDGAIYDVTAGGPGPWTQEAGVSALGPYWTSINFQNLAGSFLLACNEQGGYAIYNGTAWTMPILGDGTSGTIMGVDPAKFVFIIEWKKRLWFIEKDSTKAWYLPVSAITGIAKEFDFGEQLNHGGLLAALASWTVDGGEGIDDHLVGVGSQGDVVIYKGTDPDDATLFTIHGTWYTGPLPVGRRQTSSTGGDVFILSQFGAVPLSKLLQATALSAELQNISELIDPLITRLMQTFSTYQGWQIIPCAREALILIGVPPEATTFGGDYFAYKTTTKSWSVLRDTGYAHFVSIGPDIFAGMFDGRVVRAFDGVLDNVLIGQQTGLPIICQVTPAYQPLGDPGLQKVVKLLRPSLLAAATPLLSFRILTDYGPPKPASVPTLPSLNPSLWGTAIWDESYWSGILSPIREWLGASGVGFAATVELNLACGGDTLITSIDLWSEQGGVL